MARQFSYDVFLSHNSKDKADVRALAERLRDAGLRVWFDEWVIKPGDDIYLAIEHGIESARVLVLCLSPAAFGSGWVNLERSTVLFRDPTNAGRRFIPLLLKDCTLPDTLRRYKYVDFRAGMEAKFAELLAACLDEAELEKVKSKPLQETETLRQGHLPKSEQKKGLAKQKRNLAKPSIQNESLGTLERRIIGNCRSVMGMAVSPDSNWAVSGSGTGDGNTLKIWDLETGKLRSVLRRHIDV